MATKTVSWNDGSGDTITLTYQGQGDGPITITSDENGGAARSKVITLETANGAVTKNFTVNQAAAPVLPGDVNTFSYTGTVQEITLPKGQYKLQCWGAQGGNVTGSYAANGAKGGYSEGVLTLSQATKLYIFVGGQGSSASSGTTGGVQNGGWNGGGGAPRVSSYNSGDTNGKSYPRPGGGATDISLVTSDMTYSSYRNNRSAASLNARLIVAGGGAGASARVTTVTTTVTTYTNIGSLTYPLSDGSLNGKTYRYTDDAQWVFFTDGSPFTAGKQYRVRFSTPVTRYMIGTHQNRWVGNYGTIMLDTDSAGTSNPTFTAVAPSTNFPYIKIAVWPSPSYTGTVYFDEIGTSTTTNTTSGTSDGSQVGGGTSGGGTNPGTQSGGGGELGKGANMTQTGYRYCSGGGGGGYYGGGASYNDSTTNKINQSGGGSGYVDSSLTNAQTKAGNTSFPKTSGSGNETGHSGNGYCKITRLA